MKEEKLMKLKKTAALLMAGTLLAGMLAGCSSAPSGESAAPNQTPSAQSSDAPSQDNHNPVSITVTYAGGDETATAAMESLLNDFDAAYDWITVVQDASTAGSYDDYVATLANTGSFPDVIEMRSTETYAKAGYLAPIDQELVDMIADPQPVEGTVYTLPMTGSTPNGIIYNKEYLASLGFDNIPSVVEWNDFVKMLDAIEADGSMDAIAVGGADQWHMGFWFNKLYSDYVIKNNENFIPDVYAGKASWLDAEPRAAIQAMVDLWKYVSKGWASTGDADLATLLVNNQCAMYYSGTWMFTTISEANPDFDYGFFSITDKEGWLSVVGGSTNQGWAFSNEAAKDPDKAEAFKLLMKFLFEEDNYVNYLKAVGSVYSTTYPVTYEAAPAMANVYEIMEKADDARVMWNTEAGDKKLPDGFRNYVYKTVQEVLSGTTSLDSAMQNIQSYWEECVATAAE